VIGLTTGKAITDRRGLKAIAERQCTKTPYDGRPLGTDETAELESAGTGEGVRVHLIDDGTLRETILDLVNEGNRLQLSDPAFRSEQIAWLRFNDVAAIRSGDGLSGRATGANSEVIAGLTPDQRQLFDRFIDYMNPVSPRSAGVSFDNKAKMPGERIAEIAAPTLILHATDDGLQLYHNAEFAAATIANATLVRFDKGGHFLIGTEQSAIRTAVADHILSNAGDATPQRHR